MTYFYILNSIKKVIKNFFRFINKSFYFLKNLLKIILLILTIYLIFKYGGFFNG